MSSLVKDKAYINGAWVGGESTYEVKNPANGKVITTVPNQGPEETEKAIDAAYEVKVLPILPL